MKKRYNKAKEKIRTWLHSRVAKLVINRIILIAFIPIILLDAVLALFIMLKNWTLTKTKEINDVV